MAEPDYYEEAANSFSALVRAKLWDGTETATVTAEGWLDVKTHSPDYCFAADYAGAQAAVVIATPTAGKKVVIKQVYVSTSDNVNPIILQFTTSGNIFFKLYTTRQQATTGAWICATGAADETVTLTCPAGTFVSFGYDEI